MGQKHNRGGSKSPFSRYRAVCMRQYYRGYKDYENKQPVPEKFKSEVLEFWYESGRMQADTNCGYFVKAT